MSAETQLTYSPEDLLRDDDWRLMFHGTARELDRFTEEGVGKGGDCNSALGVHLAEWPHVASSYGHGAHEKGEGREPRVLAVLVPSLNPTEISDYFEFFGFDDNGGQKMDHAGFAEMRKDLIAQGYDIVDYEDGEGPTSVSLHPEKLLVVASLSLEQAMELNDRMVQLKDAYSGLDRYEALQQLLAPKIEPSMAL